MTHRDRMGDPPGRRGAAGDVGHRQGFSTPPAVRPRDRRRLPKAFGPRGGQRPVRLPVSDTATPRAPSQKPWAKKLGEAVSMSHFYGSLVLGLTISV